jgi:hypothetical protein
MATAANPDLSPLDFLLGVMRDPNVSLEIRIRVAQAAAPFIHGKPGAARLSDPAASAKPIDDGCGFTIVPVIARALRDDYERLNELSRKEGPLTDAEKQEESSLRARITETAKAIACPVGYEDSDQARKDSHRLYQLRLKRISPPSCGGGALTDAEDAEEVQLTARSLALAETPKAVSRRCIFELELRTISKVLSPAEQSELDRLKTLYPDPPLDLDDGCGFFIDPVIARVLRDDDERLNELCRKKWAPSEYGGPLTAAEEQEEPWLRIRIAKMAKEIGCPAGYMGSVQARKDGNRLHKLSRKRMSPPSCGGGALTDAEDAEEAQLTARSLALDQTPEAVARRRIGELELRRIKKVLSPAEQSELDRLKPLYPDRPLDPNDPLFRAIQAIDAYLERHSEH